MKFIIFFMLLLGNIFQIQAQTIITTFTRQELNDQNGIDQNLVNITVQLSPSKITFSQEGYGVWTEDILTQSKQTSTTIITTTSGTYTIQLAARMRDPQTFRLIGDPQIAYIYLQSAQGPNILYSAPLPSPGNVTTH